jgi:Na+/melibiose symporter-like transporter
MPNPGRPPVWPHVGLALYVVVALAAILWPGYAWVSANVDRTVLGLPFCMAWVAGWALASCVALGGYMKLTEREDDP